MDIIRETSHYATQLEANALSAQAERQLAFADTWLNFVRKKKAMTGSIKYSGTLPMWLLPGIHFLRYVCAPQFTEHVADEIFTKFYEHIQHTIQYLNNPNSSSAQKQASAHVRPKKPFKVPYSPLASSRVSDMSKSKTAHLTRIQQLDRLDRRTDRQRHRDGLIGKIQIDERPTNNPSISRRTEQDLACLKIRNFHKLNLLSRGQFATSKSRRARTSTRVLLCSLQMHGGLERSSLLQAIQDSTQRRSGHFQSARTVDPIDAHQARESD